MEPTPANFQIPQRNPQYQGPVPIPTDLVNSYLNRQQQELQSIPAGLRQGINDYLDYQNKQKALQIEAFGQGGPYLMNLINGNRTNPNTPNPNQNPGIQPSSGNVGIPPVAGTPGGATMGNNGQPAQTSAQTLSPNPSPAYANGTPPASQGTSPGTGGVGGESPNAAQGWQPGQPMMHPTSGLPQTIHDHMQSQGIGGQDAQAQYLASLGLQPNQAGQLASMGQFGGRALQGLQTIGNLALQPGQQQLQQQGIQKGQFEQSQQPTIAAKNQADLANAQQQVPNWIAGKSAEEQSKYNAEDNKIQAGFLALGDYYKALQAVPPNLRGAGVGIVTGKAGSAAGKQAPELVAANKARTAAITTLATALLPESSRTNPQAVQEIAASLPSVADDPKVVSAGFSDMYNKLNNQHQLLTKGSQSTVGAFGGTLKAAQVPKFDFSGQNNGTIRVRNKATGQTGTMPAANFDPNKYDKLS